MSGSVCFDIDSTDYSSQLGVEVWLNQHQHVDLSHVTEKVTVSLIVPDEGNQELKIVLKNKTDADTQVDQDNNIVRDSCLSVRNFKFDGVDCDQLVSAQAVYTHNFNDTQNTIEDEFYWCMGCNGTVSLKFYAPIYIWLLEHM